MTDDNSIYNLDWSSKLDVRKRYLTAKFLLKAVDINGALTADKILVNGKYYKVPKEQLINAVPGIVTLELEQLNI